MGNEASMISGIAKAKGGANKFLDDLTTTNDKNKPQPVSKREMDKRRKEREKEFLKRKQEREERKSMLAEKWSGQPKTTQQQASELWNKTKLSASSVALAASEKADEAMNRFSQEESDNEEDNKDVSWAQDPARKEADAATTAGTGSSVRDRLAQMSASKKQPSTRKERRAASKKASGAVPHAKGPPSKPKEQKEDAWWNE